MAKPSYETLRRKAARLEKELARLTQSQRRDEEEFRGLAEKVNSIILRMDTAGGIVFLNEYGLNFFGYGADEIIGRSVVGSIVPENESTGRDLASMIRDLCANPDRYASNENENMKKDGTRVWISWSNRAVADSTGAVNEILCVGNDITGLKKAEMAARESEERYRALYNSSIIIMYMHDFQGNFIDANDSGLTLIGYSREEMMHMTFNDLLAPEHLQKAFDITKQIMVTGFSNEAIEYRLRAKNGEEKYVEVNASLLSREGKPYGILGIARDITASKMAEEELKKNEAVLRSMLEAVPVGVGLLVDRILRKVNPSLCSITGYSESEMIGQDTRMLYPDDGEYLRVGRELYGQMEREGRGMQEACLRRKDGAIIDVLLCLSPFDPHNMSVGVTATVLDITESKLAQAENETISRISRLFLSPQGMSDIFEGITSVLTSQFNFPVTGIARYDGRSDEVEYLGSTGIPWDGPGRPRFASEKTMAGTVIRTGASIVDLDVTARPDYAALALSAMGIRTFICEPIVIGGAVFGAIVMGDGRIRAEAPRIARTIRIIADYLSREIYRRRMEETLKESEELTRNLMSSVNEGIVIFDREFRILIWNRFMVELTGIPAEQVTGGIYTDFFPYIKNRSVLDDLKRAQAGETLMSGDLEYEFTASGRKGWMIGQFTPLRNSTDDVIGIIVSVRDITRRKMAEVTLGRTQEDLRETLEATTDGIWTWSAWNNEYYFSPRFYTMLGYEPGEFPATFISFRKLIHPDDLRQTMEVIRNFTSSEEVDVYQNECRLKTRNGSYRWIYSRARVVERDEEGRVLRLIGNHQDITDRKIAEERLRWQLAVNMALSGLSGSIISQSYTISDVAIIVLEYARLLTDSEDGYVSEIVGGTGDNVILSTTMRKAGEHPMDVKKSHAGSQQGGTRHYGGLWGHALNTRQAFFTNSPLDHASWGDPPPDHQPVNRFLSVPVLFYNELVGQISLANASRDYDENDLVTVRRLGSLYAMAINRIRNENSLRRSLHEKEVLIKELHHRVKNNMQVISSLLGLQSRKIEDEKYRKYFEESQNRIHAMAMVHEKLYRAEDMARVDFSEYITELTRYLFYSYNIDRHAVRLNIDVRDIYLGIDTAVPCAMIINELVTNAIKHAFPHGRTGELSVTLVKNDRGRHLLAVRDDGIGLPEGSDTAAMNTLGMQIVQSLTRQIGGTLTMDGKGGTSIVIEF